MLVDIQLFGKFRYHIEEVGNDKIEFYHNELTKRLLKERYSLCFSRKFSPLECCYCCFL